MDLPTKFIIVGVVFCLGIIPCLGVLLVLGAVFVLGAEFLLADGEEYVNVSRLGVEEVVFDDKDELDLDNVLVFDGALDLCDVLGLEYELFLLYEFVALTAIIITSF